MKIQAFSDLHLEFKPADVELELWIPDISPQANVVVLAGDIATRPELAAAYLKTIPQRIPVVYILGNHEYYYNHLGIASKYREAVNEINATRETPIHFLDNESACIDNVLFFGSTLWTDFDKQRAILSALQVMNDFDLIHLEANSCELINPYDIILLYRKAVQDLRTFFRVTRDPAQKRIIVTHHSPSFSLVDNTFRESIINGCYFSDLDSLIDEESPDFWIYGHCHRHKVSEVYRTVTICNPLGYPSEKHTGFKQNFLMEV